MNIDWDLPAIAFDQRTKDWLDELSDTEKRLIVTFVNAHETPLEFDCSDGPTIVLDIGDALDHMYKREYTCCGWAQSRLRLDEWDHDLLVGSNHGH